MHLQFHLAIFVQLVLTLLEAHRLASALLSVSFAKLTSTFISLLLYGIDNNFSYYFLGYYISTSGSSTYTTTCIYAVREGAAVCNDNTAGGCSSGQYFNGVCADTPAGISLHDTSLSTSFKILSSWF